MPAAISDGGAHRGSDDQLKQNLQRDPQSRGGSRYQQILGEHGGENHGHRIVDARLHLQGHPHPALELKTAAPQHGEDGGGIGG